MVTHRRALLDRDIALADDLRPLGRLGLHDLAQLFGRARRELEADFGHLLPQTLIGHRLRYFGVEPRDASV